MTREFELNANLFDGLTPFAQEGRLRCSATGFTFTSNSTSLSFALAAVEKVEIRAQQQLVLRLTPENGKTATELRILARQKHFSLLCQRLKLLEHQSLSEHLFRKVREVPFAVYCTIMPIFIFSLAFFLLKTSGHLHHATPVRFDNYLGDKTNPIIEDTFTVCEDPKLNFALQKMLLSLQKPEDNFRLRVAILKTDSVNAFALPGGQMYMLGGLLAKSSDPEEVMGVLAHEIAHVEKRHSVRNLFKTAGTVFVTSAILGTGFEGLESGERLGDLTSSLMFLQYSRDFEREADMSARARLNSKGFGSRGLHQFFARDASRRKSSDWEAWLQTHPTSRERSTFFSSPQTISNGSPLPISAEEWSKINSGCL